MERVVFAVNVLVGVLCIGTGAWVLGYLLGAWSG